MRSNITHRLISKIDILPVYHDMDASGYFLLMNLAYHIKAGIKKGHQQLPKMKAQKLRSQFLARKN